MIKVIVCLRICCESQIKCSLGQTISQVPKWWRMARLCEWGFRTEIHQPLLSHFSLVTEFFIGKVPFTTKIADWWILTLILDLSCLFFPEKFRIFLTTQNTGSNKVWRIWAWLVSIIRVKEQKWKKNLNFVRTSFNNFDKARETICDVIIQYDF